MNIKFLISLKFFYTEHKGNKDKNVYIMLLSNKKAKQKKNTYV